MAGSEPEEECHQLGDLILWYPRVEVVTSKYRRDRIAPEAAGILADAAVEGTLVVEVAVDIVALDDTAHGVGIVAAGTADLAAAIRSEREAADTAVAASVEGRSAEHRIRSPKVFAAGRPPS